MGVLEQWKANQKSTFLSLSFHALLITLPAAHWICIRANPTTSLLLMYSQCVFCACGVLIFWVKITWEIIIVVTSWCKWLFKTNVRFQAAIHQSHSRLPKQFTLTNPLCKHGQPFLTSIFLHWHKELCCQNCGWCTASTKMPGNTP